jgi:apolipoprotein N-acyltransferase
MSFPPLPLGFLAYIAFIPILAATEGKPIGIAFRSSMLAGATFGLLLLYWIANMWVEPNIKPFLLGGVGLLCVYMGFAFAFPFLGAAFARARFGRIGVLCLPFFFVGLEFLRSLSHLGFPWGSLAYTQTSYVGLIQFASVTSVAGVSFWVVSVNIALYLLVFGRMRPMLKSACVAVLALLFLLPAVQWFMLPKSLSGASVKVALVQAGVPPSLKRSEEYEKRFAILADETRRLSKGEVDLIVWPESSVPGYFRNEEDYEGRVREMASTLGAPIVLGSNDYVEGGHAGYSYFNSFFLVPANEGPLQVYNKMHLVPFGERLPFDDVFPKLRDIPLGQGNFSPGREYKVLSIEKGKFGPLVCFESIFPRMVRRFVSNGAQFLVNITDDGWYGRTSGPFQHTEMAVLRCIENRISMARCANTGVSMFIDPYGRTKGRTGLFTRVVESSSIPLRTGGSFYSRHGDVFGWCVVAIGLALIGLIAVKRAGTKAR